MLRILLLVVLFSSQALACLWDRDTLAEEAKGRPDLPRLIIGWFDRYPPRYYQMRLDRVTAGLKSTPADLALLDDAAVACDRLGKPDEAIAWMVKKKAVLDTLPANEAKDDRYRYLSNLGTFHLHRWILLPQAQRDADLSDLRESERLIALAIEENPDAHFGREVYQLAAIRWLLWDGVGPIETAGDSPLVFDSAHWVSYVSAGRGEDHIGGISGLIQLGIAWESSDAFRSLALVLEGVSMSAIAELAYLRANELLSSGKGSLHPVASVREAIVPEYSINLTKRKPVDDWYPIARAAAERRNDAWIAYQNMRFAQGLHPDTDPDFWKDWTEPAFPELPDSSWSERLRGYFEKRFFLSAALFIGAWAVVVVFVWKLIRKATKGMHRAT